MKQNNNKPDIDMILAILIGIIVLSVLFSITAIYLKMMSMWLAITIPAIAISVLVIYLIVKAINQSTPILPKIKRPELEDIISPFEAWNYVKIFFRENYGVLLKLNAETSYLKMKTVGSEGYETKIYSFYAQEENKDRIDYYNIVIPGHEPRGALFLKNEDNPDKIRELEEGLAMKSKQFITEIETHEDELSGRRITKKKTMPLEEQKEETEEETEEEKSEEEK